MKGKKNKWEKWNIGQKKFGEWEMKGQGHLALPLLELFLYLLVILRLIKGLLGSLLAERKGWKRVLAM